MSTALKCPNPSCSYLFDPTSVPTGVMLACPRCGMRFTLGLPTAIPPTQAGNATGTVPGTAPGVPGSPPGSASPPGFPPTQPGNQVSGAPSPPGTKSTNAAFGEMTPETAHADGEEGLGSPIRGSRLQSFILTGLVAIAITVAAIAVWYKLTYKETEIADSATRLKEFNLSFEPPPDPWIRDEDTRVLLGSPFILVFKRDNPEAFMAFGAKDYDPRSPRESELEKGITKALEKIVDLSTLRPDPTQIDQSWMGQDIKGFKFHAQLKTGAAIDGEAYRFAHKGIGYWFLAWTGENNIYEEMLPYFRESRGHCKLLDLRNDWKERQSAVVPFKGDRTGYTILDAEGIWEEDNDEANLKFEGEGADKILKLKKGRNKDEIQDSKLIVYVLARPGETMDVAREFVIGRRKEEIKRAGDYPIAFTDITAPPEGDAIPSPVENPLPVIRLKSVLKADPNQNRFHVISAAKIEDKIVIVHAYTSLPKKDALETLFIQIASSLH